jgi:hypothetical protein
MATATFHSAFKEHVMEGVHIFGTHQVVVYLTAAGSAPVAGNSVLADLTPISYTNLSSRNVTTSSSGLSGTTQQVVFTDLVLTASGGSVAAFRYVGLYNDTPTSPADPLIMFYDYGSALTLANTETLTIDFASPSITLA